jgi:hypothetical protein
MFFYPGRAPETGPGAFIVQKTEPKIPFPDLANNFPDTPI